MSIWQYLLCLVIALVGMAIQVALKMKSLQEKAIAANAEFHPRLYFNKDWLSIILSLLNILLFMLLAGAAVDKWHPEVIVVQVAFAFIGYTGADIASRLFGVVGKKINNIMDFKANGYDGVVSSNDATKTKIQ
jgi:hypothetical protein